jgi:hypothetical protein
LEILLKILLQNLDYETLSRFKITMWA